MTTVFKSTTMYIFILVIGFFAYHIRAENTADTSTSTTLQLRDSVTFSYSVTNLFLDLIRGNRPPTALMQVYVNIMSSQNSRVSFRQVEPVVSSYLGYAICTTIGILFIILMPIIGCIFFCARCCGKCGAHVQLMDKKKDPCKRVAYTVILSFLVTFQLVAIVLAFINHYLLHEALVSRDPRVGAFSQLNLSLIETENNLREMLQMAKNTSSTNLDVQKQRFMSLVDAGLLDFQRDFAERSQAHSVSQLIEELQSTARQSVPNSDGVGLLNQFNDSLHRVVAELPTIQTGLIDTIDMKCPFEKHQNCKELMMQAKEKLRMRYFPKMLQFDEMMALSGQIQRHMADIDALNEFNLTINDLASIVKRSIQNDLSRAWTDLAQSPKTREELTAGFELLMGNFSQYVNRIKRTLDLEQNEEYNTGFLKFVEFRLYGGIALLCLPILILLLLYFGLCFGICGGRPYEEAGLCNRGVGAHLLMAGVDFTFIFSAILMIACVVLFLAGGPAQTELCRYLTGRYPNGPLELDKYFYESTKYIVTAAKRPIALPPNVHSTPSPELATIELIMNISRFNLADAILTRCEHEPFVVAISSGNLPIPLLDVAIGGILQDLINSFNSVDLIGPLQRTIQSCSNTMERIKFLDAVNFTLAISQLSTPITQMDNLNAFVAALRSLQMNEIIPYIDALENGPLVLDELRNRVRHVYTRLDSFPGQYQNVLRGLDQFNGNLSSSVELAMNRGLIKLRPIFIKELKLAVIATWHDIPCRSLRLSVRRGVDTFCYTLLMPLNAFWAGLGFTLLLFIPVIIFAVKLSSLYRKTEEYSSDYEEPDYISYHGFYMRPSSEYQTDPQRPRNKQRKHKAKNGYSAGNSSNNRGPSGYQHVSVYPYDAYE